MNKTKGKCIGLEDESTSISFGRDKSRPNIRNESIDEDTDQWRVRVSSWIGWTSLQFVVSSYFVLTCFIESIYYSSQE